MGGGAGKPKAPPQPDYFEQARTEAERGRVMLAAKAEAAALKKKAKEEAERKGNPLDQLIDNERSKAKVIADAKAQAAEDIYAQLAALQASLASGPTEALSKRLPLIAPPVVPDADPLREALARVASTAAAILALAKEDATAIVSGASAQTGGGGGGQAAAGRPIRPAPRLGPLVAAGGGGHGAPAPPPASLIL